MDDFLHAGDHRFEKLMEKLRARFSAGKVEEKTFKYIGFQVEELNQRTNGPVNAHLRSAVYTNFIEIVQV